jgi:hypothetical protein
LLINLFSGIPEIDHYNIRGKGFLELSKIERNLLDEAIKATITNDI